MRTGIDGLSQRIQNALGRSPCDGSAYAFRNRRQNRLKLLIWDGTGVWLCQRRLHRGHFIWPSADTPVSGRSTVRSPKNSDFLTHPSIDAGSRADFKSLCGGTPWSTTALLT